MRQFSPEFRTTYTHIYEQSYHRLYKPALDTLVRTLDSLLNETFAGSQRTRLRVEPGRIKSANRLLLKAAADKYTKRITQPTHVFEVIRDIVGTRVTCNTLSDVRDVVVAIKAAATRRQTVNNVRVLSKTHRDWEDDYISKPKPSGYRAVNLLIGVPVVVGTTHQNITCEIQIRTLLQHSWGELTHEDTYKPGVKVPPLVEALSKRLANALAVLDEIAQDIREAIEQVEAAALEEPPQTQDRGPAPTSPRHEQPSGTTTAASLVPVPSPGSTTPSADDLAAPVSSLSPASVVRVYGEVFSDREPPSLSEAEGALGDLRANGVLSDELLKIALQNTSEVLDEVLGTYDYVTLTAYGRLFHAAAIWKSRELGVAALRGSLDPDEEEGKQLATFRAAHPVGEEVLGTIGTVKPDYALIALANGTTAILHVTAVKGDPRDYLDLSDFLSEGDTVRVRIENVTAERGRRRVELSLPEEERRRIGIGDSPPRRGSFGGGSDRW